jgi:signal transduction histidine kinase
MTPAPASKEVSNTESPAYYATSSYNDESSKAVGVPMSRWLAGLSRLPRPLTAFLALVLAAFIGWMDYATGYDVRMTGFYLIPICWVSWALGRKAGLWLGVATTVICGVADALSTDANLHPFIPLWNTLMLLTVFVLAVYAITAALSAYRSLAAAQALLKNSNERLEEIVQQRTAALRSEIAERQRLEQVKLQAERLLERQEKLATLGTLTAGIAHEIRNPLTSLKARLYTLEKHVQNLPAARKDTDIINAEISRLERIVQDALSFARPADPKLEPMAADTLLREVQGLMSTSMESRGVHLVIEAHPGLLIRADSGHLKQVLINLVRNAVEAIDGEGTVTLCTRPARALLGGRETDVVMLEVSDTGKGIPPEVEKRLFDPFFSTKETGTGLGLPIAARIVERHGGTLQYQSRPGHGTTFGVVLPREINDTEKGAKSSANIPSGGG